MLDRSSDGQLQSPVFRSQLKAYCGSVPVSEGRMKTTAHPHSWFALQHQTRANCDRQDIMKQVVEMIRAFDCCV